MRISLRSLTGVLFCVIAAGAALAAPASAAVPDAKGTEFWLAFNTNAGNGGTRTLMITGSEATTGTVEVPGVSFSAPFSVTPGAITTVELPDNTELAGTGTRDVAVHVTAAKEVVVYGLNRWPQSTDAFLGLPVDALGTRHTVMAWDAVAESQFAVVASQDATTVTITPAAAVPGHAAGVPYDITLNRGQAYQAQSLGELTGSTVVASQPVAVFGGNMCAYVPNDATLACDHLVEQQPPDDAWGRRFLTVPLKTRSGGDTFRILASQADTEVTINGTTVATLGAGGFHTQLIDGSSEIESSKPVLVAQFANGSFFDGALGDPFMMLVAPVEQFQTGYTVGTPASGFATNVLNLVVPASSVGVVQVDGTAVPAGAYSAIGTSGFFGAQVDVALGSHTVTGSGEPFGVFVYGFGEYDSYGYPGGLSLAPIARVASVALAPPTETLEVGTEGCVTATVTDDNDAAVEGVRVDFAVSGANTATGSEDTTADGTAEFCYTGTQVGTDAITATAGSESDSAAKTWIDTNEAPVAVDDAYDVIGGAVLTVPAPGVLGNDTDTDDDALTAQPVDGPSSGTLVLNPNGSFTYTPGEDTVGPVTFTYRAFDGRDTSNLATVTITVAPGCDGRRATIVGTPGVDRISQTNQNDVILALGGDDVIDPGSGRDLVCAGSGNDRVQFSSENDVIHGGSGDDILDGGSGDDRLFGDAGVDRLRGGSDRDALDGGAGSPDRCDGEGDADTATACETLISVP